MAEYGLGDELEWVLLFLSAGLWNFHSLEMVSKYLGWGSADEEPTLKCDYACV